MRHTRRIAGTGLTLIASAAGWIWAISLANEPTPGGPARVARPLPIPAAHIAANMPEPPQSAEIATRPLFSPTRRPYVPPPALQTPVESSMTVSPAQPVLEALSLAGVLIDGEQRQALLTASSFPQGRWATVGDTLAGYRIDHIETGGIELSSAGGNTTLRLYVDADESQSVGD